MTSNKLSEAYHVTRCSIEHPVSFSDSPILMQTNQPPSGVCGWRCHCGVLAGTQAPDVQIFKHSPSTSTCPRGRVTRLGVRDSRREINVLQVSVKEGNLDGQVAGIGGY